MKIWGISNPVEHDAGVVQDRTTNEDITARKKTSSLARELIEEILNSPQAEDNRDDPAERAGKTNKKKKRKKKSHKITVGRNNDSDNNNADREQSATSESRSKMLTRLLFSKQNMEQHDQMKVVYRHFGPYAEAVLAIVQEEGMPSPDTAGHVVVKVQASTVTLEDCLIRRGFDFDLLNPVCLPQTPGFDIVGHICAVGSHVPPHLKEGDRVATMVRTGGNARFVSLPADCLVKIPRNIDSAEAVAMVSIYTTAYQTLKRITQEGPLFSLLGKKVLILGGMDSVGQALIQMCGKAGAEIYAPTPHHHQSFMLNVLGAHPLPESKNLWLPLVEGQMDYVFDGICEDGLDTSYKALTEKGELVCFGHTAMLREREMGILGAPISAHFNKLWCHTKPRTKSLDIWDSFRADPTTYKKNLKSLCQLLKWNKIKPNIARIVSLSEVAEAQSKLESGDLRGTVVCLPWKNVESKGTKRV